MFVNGRWILSFVILLISLSLASCSTPMVQAVGPVMTQPSFDGEIYKTADGVELVAQSWQAENPQAIILGIHGMNDYSKTFNMSGPWFASNGISVIAYDQRGFGRSPQFGIWPGDDKLVQDVANMLDILKQRYPGIPIYILGVSMGGAVALSLNGGEGDLDVDGQILVAPAVWGWSTLNPLYKLPLRVAAHTFPGRSFTGKGLKIMPSDNIEMLRDNFKDPYMIKETRTDMIYGLVSLMERGYQSAEHNKTPTLILYGDQDQIIPRKPVESIISRMNDVSLRTYENGYHMLLRDLQAEIVWNDIKGWVVLQSERNATVSHFH